MFGKICIKKKKSTSVSEICEIQNVTSIVMSCQPLCLLVLGVSLGDDDDFYMESDNLCVSAEMCSSLILF